jgi:hypothetical protein
MGTGGAKRFVKPVWRFTKWAIGGTISLIGLGGLPDALNSWAKFFTEILARVGAIMTDPRAEYLASKAVAVADFVNQTPVRVALVIVGVAILIWGWRPFWSLRHRLRFAWRTFLGEETWISHEEATKLIRASDWAKLREPVPGFVESTARLLGGGMSAYDRDVIRYRRYIQMTLESFETSNPTGVRESDGNKMYSERLLRHFVASALDDEAIARFGKIPT